MRVGPRRLLHCEALVLEGMKFVSTVCQPVGRRQARRSQIRIWRSERGDLSLVDRLLCREKKMSEAQGFQNKWKACGFEKDEKD